MEALTEKQIRESFVNCSKEDASRLFVPSGLGFAPWDELDYFGWRDPSSPGKYHLVYWRGEEPVGIVLRRADQAATRYRFHMCSLCHTAQPGQDVALFTAPLAGEAGRNGSTVGTYICAELTCSAHARLGSPVSPTQTGPYSLVLANRARLLERVDRFLADVDRSR